MDTIADQLAHMRQQIRDQQKQLQQVQHEWMAQLQQQVRQNEQLQQLQQQLQQQQVQQDKQQQLQQQQQQQQQQQHHQHQAVTAAMMLRIGELELERLANLESCSGKKKKQEERESSVGQGSCKVQMRGSVAKDRSTDAD